MWQKQHKAIINDYIHNTYFNIACVFSFVMSCVNTSFMSTTTDMKTPSDEGKEKASERELLRWKPRSILTLLR